MIIVVLFVARYAALVRTPVSAGKKKFESRTNGVLKLLSQWVVGTMLQRKKVERRIPQFFSHVQGIGLVSPPKTFTAEAAAPFAPTPRSWDTGYRITTQYPPCLDLLD